MRTDLIALESSAKRATGRRRRAVPISLIVGSIMLALLIAVMFFGRALAPHDAEAISFDTLASPDAAHLLGTDSIGRDTWSRMLVGTQTTMVIAFSTVAIALLVGLVIGLMSAYFGGWVDQLIMRLLDIILAFPAFLLAITVVAVLGNSMPNLVLTLAIIYTPMMARIVRGPVLSIRSWDHVTAARAVGASNAAIISKHILPIAISPVLVEAALMIANIVFTVTALSFLGLGTPPPAPNWGTMLSDSRQFMELAPFTAIGPTLAIVYAALTFILFSAGLRRALNVQERS